MVGWRAVEVGVGHFEVPGDKRLEHDFRSWNASDGQRALGGAVVSNSSADDLVTRGLARELEVLLDELDCTLNSFAAAGSEENVIQIPGCKRRLQSRMKKVSGREVMVNIPDAPPALWHGGARRTRWGSNRESWPGGRRRQPALGARAQAAT